MDTKVDYLKLEDVIAYVKHEVHVFQVKENTVCRQLEDMKNKSGTSFWPKPLLIPC